MWYFILFGVLFILLYGDKSPSIGPRNRAPQSDPIPSYEYWKLELAHYERRSLSDYNAWKRNTYGTPLTETEIQDRERQERDYHASWQT